MIPPEKLIDGAMRTLRERVLPDVGSSFARGQAYAVIDVLNNLRDRVEIKRAFAEADALAASQALDGVAAALREAGDASAAATLEAAVAEAASGSPEARAEALRRSVIDALAALPDHPEAAREPARNALRGYLVSQAIRDVAPLKPSMLSEISRGEASETSPGEA